MQRQGLITLQDDELHINLAHSRTLQLLAAGARENAATLCHHLLAVECQPVDQPRYAGEKRAAPSRNVSPCCTVSTRRSSSTRRCSVLLVLTLRDEGYISDSGDAEPAETMKVYQLLAELITSDVRLTIESATQGEG